MAAIPRLSPVCPARIRPSRPCRRTLDPHSPLSLLPLLDLEGPKPPPPWRPLPACRERLSRGSAVVDYVALEESFELDIPAVPDPSSSSPFPAVASPSPPRPATSSLAAPIPLLMGKLTLPSFVRLSSTRRKRHRSLSVSKPADLG